MTHDEVLQGITDAGEALAKAVECEMKLEDNRARIKTRAILRLMETENIATKKLHSGSSAESVVSSEPEYAAYLEEQRGAAVLTIRARAQYEVAKARARLAAGLSEVLS